MSQKNLDSRIKSAIRLATKRSPARFNHYLEGHGVARRIEAATPKELDGFCIAGEVALISCLAEYTHQRWTPETRMRHYGTLKTRILCAETYGLIIDYARSKGCKLVNTAHSSDVLYLFAGALLATLGCNSTFGWFVEVFGPILDEVCLVNDAYWQQESRKRKSYLDNEDSDAKRAKVDTGERQGFTISRSILRELGTDATTRCASYTSGRLNAPTSPQPPTVFHDLETTPSPTPALSLWASTATSLIQPGSFWYMTTLAQAQTRELLAGMNAYTQREIAAFRQASRGKSIGSLPMAFFSGLVSAFNHDADTKLRGTKLLVQRTTRLSAKRKVLPPIVPEHRVTPPFRRSRAPSPSPKPNLSANNASYIKYKYKYKENVKPATPTTTVHAMRRAPYALPARNRHLSIYPQDSQGTKTQRALAYSSLRPATSTRCFGAYPNHYQQCGFF